MGVQKTSPLDKWRWAMLGLAVIFLVSGAALVGVGSVGHRLYSRYLAWLESGFMSLPTLFIFVGMAVVTASGIGICGAARANPCMLTMFSLLLGMTFIAALSGAIESYAKRHRMSETVVVNMRTSLIHLGNNTIHGFSYATWQKLQTRLHCCGADSYLDWFNATSVHMIPVSCCNQTLYPLDAHKQELPGDFNASRNGSCPRGFLDIISCKPSVLDLELAASSIHLNTSRICPLYQRGCAALVREDVKLYMAQVAGIGMTISLLQFVGVIVAFLSVHKIRATLASSSPVS
ncbi:hypothetical protein RvY_06275 [Ramazzottius varieornatus]|uniref:Tetraspanin n=1 Tax=Ramazzottius varieornatus TaxID=947166 RepID=A0A1D1UXZ2_RAMVA|nr:hypothetical protein RvY_06275 [Ramazzottius varieornatus]